MMALFTAIYAALAVLLAFYTLGQGVLLVQYLRLRRQQPATPPAPDVWPRVLVQLPVYNERHVIPRLLAAIQALDYPHDRLTVQVLDDSTDTTTDIIRQTITQLGDARFEHVRRTDRTGYKAGALAYGLQHDDSELVVIFDADFVPPADFLKQTVPHLLADDRRGVVQTRWGHRNADTNTLTRAQRLAVDAHFIIEQTARSQSGWFVPFNGTGGVWRRACIESSGGWSGDTLTEDLDLSFRAQLNGWQSLYLPDVVVPGDLPAQFAAYQQQQARWATGSTQNLLRHGWAVLTATGQPLGVRLMALHHLCQYLPQPILLFLLILTPLMMLSDGLTQISLAPLGILSLIPPVMYAVSQRTAYPNAAAHLRAFPALLVIGIGLLWTNTRAVIAGLNRQPQEFRRTPKYDGVRDRYALRPVRFPAEFGWMTYALMTAGLSAVHAPELLPYLLIYAGAFATVSLWQVRDRRELG